MSSMDEDDMKVWMILWLTMLVIFLLAPFCSSTGRRRVCFQRIRRCTWDIPFPEERFLDFAQGRSTPNVENNGENNSSSSSNTNNNNNNNTSLPGGVSSIWEEKQILLLEKLSDYTLELTKSDFHQLSLTCPITLNESSTLEHDGIDDDVELGEEGLKENPIKTVVSIPLPGNAYDAISGMKKRDASVMCAICLCAFETQGARICWSSNVNCPHVFHEECIVQWLMSLITKQRMQWQRENDQRSARNNNNNNNNNRSRRNRNARMLQQRQQATNNTTTTADNTHTVTTTTTTTDTTTLPQIVSGSELMKSLPKECPCCRQDFIFDDGLLKEEEKEKDDDDTSGTENSSPVSSFEEEQQQPSIVQTV